MKILFANDYLTLYKKLKKAYCNSRFIILSSGGHNIKEW